MSSTTPAPSPDTPITIKIALDNGENRRFKLPLRELGANSLPDKVCFMSQPQPSPRRRVHPTNVKVIKDNGVCRINHP